MSKLLMALVLLASGVGSVQQAATENKDAQMAIAAVLRHYVLNGEATVPETGKALDGMGSWSTLVKRPSICPADGGDPCVGVHYRQSGVSVDCFWVVLLKGGIANAEFLEENTDAEKYLIRKVTSAEAKTLILSASTPIYPAIAEAANSGGTWLVRFTVGVDGNA